MTLNPREWYTRWKLLNRTKEIEALEKKLAELQAKARTVKEEKRKDDLGEIDSDIRKTIDKISDAYFKMNDKWLVMKHELEKINPADRPKAFFCRQRHSRMTSASITLKGICSIIPTPRIAVTPTAALAASL